MRGPVSTALIAAAAWTVATWTAPARAAAASVVPIASVASPEALVARGKAAFVHRCRMCHGEGQTGAFILNRRLGAAKALLEKRDDLQPAYVRLVVRNGLVNMPRLSRVEMPEPDLDAVIVYLTANNPPK
jgi:mono/diheme cytochrome c family protein